MTMKLLGMLASPYVRKVRVVLNEKKIEYEFVLEDINAADSKISEFNPLGKIPCLIMEDGKTIYDSSVIVDYLDTMTPVGNLLPTTGRARAEVKCCEALADGVLDAAVLARLEKAKHAAKEQSPAWIAYQMSKVHAGLKVLSQNLADKPFFLRQSIFSGRYCSRVCFRLAIFSFSRNQLAG